MFLIYFEMLMSKINFLKNKKILITYILIKKIILKTIITILPEKH